jgi:membrane fusion protein (multidrug efflux system)
VPVKIGVRRDAKVEIVEGISAGDQVVTAGMRLSRDGQPVRILSPAAGKGDADKGGADKGGAAPTRDGAGKV